MKVSVDVTLRPFTVPNFVLIEEKERPRSEGFVEPQKFALGDLSSETLEKLCEEFTDSVFKKAGKNRPPQEAK